MATSRLEKIGTIFTRVNGLLKSGAMKWEDRPLWYDIYQAFPPAAEPRYDRPAPDIEVKRIFYKEDIIRAKYHMEVKPGISNLFNDDYKTKTQRFIEAYTSLKNTENINKDEIFEMAVSAVGKELEDKKLAREKEKEDSSLLKTFKFAKEEQLKKVDVGKIMKEE